jgi:NosR/NirI family transcriptional regulator, nitrous oxide reductase regulator
MASLRSGKAACRGNGQPSAGKGRLRRTVPMLALILTAGVLLEGRFTQLDGKIQAQLRQLFPGAASFSPKEGDPPHFKAYDQRQIITGYAFWTTELEPLERGYDGPIKILVGMAPNGVLTGIVVAQHNEPYGNFSIDPPQFPAQFKGKNIRDPFRVGGDIHAVSRATITMTSAARAVRNSARRVARQLLTPPQ